MAARRDVANCVEAFLSFPPDVVRPSWAAVLFALLPRFAAHCHTLSRSCTQFCRRAGSAAARKSPGRSGRSPVGVRRLMLATVGAFARHPDAAELLRPMLPTLLRRLADRVQSVVVAARAVFPRVRFCNGAVHSNCGKQKFPFPFQMPQSVQSSRGLLGDALKCSDDRMPVPRVDRVHGAQDAQDLDDVESSGTAPASSYSKPRLLSEVASPPSSTNWVGPLPSGHVSALRMQSQ
jgi:hypothetical protein